MALDPAEIAHVRKNDKLRARILVVDDHAPTCELICEILCSAGMDADSVIGTPEQHPDVYANASPISHIDRLQRPLLVLHGTPDVNVPYLESVRLIDEALKKGKGDLVTFMMYPGEFHYFAREHVLRDVWHRVDDFFALHFAWGSLSRPLAAKPSLYFHCLTALRGTTPHSKATATFAATVLVPPR